MKKSVILGALIVQGLCTFFFFAEIMMAVLGFPPIAWQYHEFIELGVCLGLILGVVFGAVALRRTQRMNDQMADQLRIASGAFMEIIEESFETWGLTPAERDVALFSLKGVPAKDIARMRETSEGTVKAQTNAIYRKAGVTGRTQLMSLFLDELMDGGVTH